VGGKRTLVAIVLVSVAVGRHTGRSVHVVEHLRVSVRMRVGVPVRRPLHLLRRACRRR
jgi:hypothetical protein